MAQDATGRETLVVATTNRGKLAELRALLAGLPIAICTIEDVAPDAPAVTEDGATFEENALKKARAAASATKMLAVADDSGLEVDALGGRPGVRSARFAHDSATDDENNAALLAAVGAAADAGALLRARFRCVLALVDPVAEGGKSWTAEGVCEGAITHVPRGSRGFGYDCVFVVDGRDETMAELADDEKNRISHRARACAALRPIIERVLVGRAGGVAVP
jgi:XTP/dITP diphosphohydrolase